MRARLYLITPKSVDLAAFLPALEEALGAGDVACVLIAPAVTAEAHLQRIAEALTPAIQAAGAAALVADDTRAMGRARADGLHVTGGTAAIADAAERLQGKGIVGAGEVRSRHEAMEAAEAGADYVFFGLVARDDDEDVHPKTMDLGGWWAELMEPPCVLLAGRSMASVETCARTGADFVALRDAVWDHPDGPAAAVREANAILDRVAGESGGDTA